MDRRSTVIAFPGGVDIDDATSAQSVALREVDAAIALVVAGVAGRVRLAGMPFLDAVATTALSRARAAGLAFRLEPTDRQGAVTATIGPFEPAASG